MNAITFSELKKRAKTSDLDPEQFGDYKAVDKNYVYIAGKTFVSKWKVVDNGQITHISSVILGSRHKFSKHINNVLFCKFDISSLPDDTEYIHNFYDLYEKVLNMIELSAENAGISPDQIKLYKSLLDKRELDQLLVAMYEDDNTVASINVYTEIVQQPEYLCLLTLYFNKLEQFRFEVLGD